MSPVRRRWLFWAPLLALLAAGLGYAFRPQPVPVDVAMVGRGELLVTVDEEGVARVRDVFVVSSPVGGRVRRVTAEVGDPVSADATPIARIEPSDPAFLDLRSRSEAEAAVKATEAALALAEAERRRVTAELDQARADVSRARTLLRRETISAVALERAETEVRTREARLAEAEAQVRMRRFELETARARLIGPDAAAAFEGCCVEVRAPVDGIVLRVMRKSEAVIAAGTPLVEIGDPSDLELVVDVLSQDAVRIRQGAEVMIVDWGGGRTLEGRVRRVEPTAFTKVSALGIDEQRVNVIVDLTSPREAWAAIGHGYRVEARIVVWRGADVLTVPMSALFRQRDRWALFVAEAGRARLRTVAIGASNGRLAEVVEGLVEGERVVLYPSDRVGDDVRIVDRAELLIEG